MLTLKPKQAGASSHGSLDLAGFRPDAFAEQTLDDVRRHALWFAGESVEAGELFTIDGDPTDSHWRFEGDLTTADHLGQEMTAGVIHVEGNVGNRVGAQMRGGRITVAGAAGDELGTEMRRGLIAVQGAVGSLAGYRMKAGTILALGAAGPRVGAEMVRGTIGLFGEQSPTLLPTFRYACDFEPAWLPMLAQQSGCELPRRVALFSGDLLFGGRGEVLTHSGAR